MCISNGLSSPTSNPDSHQERIFQRQFLLGKIGANFICETICYIELPRPFPAPIHPNAPLQSKNKQILSGFFTDGGTGLIYFYFHGTVKFLTTNDRNIAI